MFRLIIFDLDGTLVEPHTARLLPGVKDFFRLVFQNSCHPETATGSKIAIATNQGGVGMRYWMERDNFGNPQDYPSEAEIIERLSQITAELGEGQNISTYVCYRYKDRTGKGTPIPPDRTGDPCWSTEWRKPSPGMLLQAMRDARVPAEETLFIGNGSADAGAARAAGCAFQWASDFFAKNWEDCRVWEEINQ